MADDDLRLGEQRDQSLVVALIGEDVGVELRRDPGEDARGYRDGKPVEKQGFHGVFSFASFDHVNEVRNVARCRYTAAIPRGRNLVVHPRQVDAPQRASASQLSSAIAKDRAVTPNLREGRHEPRATAGRVYCPYHRHTRVPAIRRREGGAARALADPANRRCPPPKHSCLQFCSTGDPGITDHTRFGSPPIPAALKML